jgi:hypothetical protein
MCHRKDYYFVSASAALHLSNFLKHTDQQKVLSFLSSALCPHLAKDMFAASPVTLCPHIILNFIVQPHTMLHASNNFMKINLLIATHSCHSLFFVFFFFAVCQRSRCRSNVDDTHIITHSSKQSVQEILTHTCKETSAHLQFLKIFVTEEKSIHHQQQLTAATASSIATQVS